ncbi:MAG TPA: hypothetical protein VMI73_26075 [Trebonia sp.]|nr:hypothetical protein [Trebonia sp.]
MGRLLRPRAAAAGHRRHQPGERHARRRQSSDVIGPAISPPSESLLEVLTGTASFDPAAICSADSVQSVSPAPVNHPPKPQTFGHIPGLTGTSGMSDLYRSYRSDKPEQG